MIYFSTLRLCTHLNFLLHQLCLLHLMSLPIVSLLYHDEIITITTFSLSLYSSDSFLILRHCPNLRIYLF
jgi:hypothetical protein